MSDTNTNSAGSGNSDSGENLDHIEQKEDEREESQLDSSLEEDGLLPVPEATPADGQAPGA